MSTIRTAMFLATQERLRQDAGKTRKTNKRVKCNPPNKVCGARCIPQDWDCRLKGEGNDSHMKAVGRGSDPLAAIANLQRGGGRIIKGLAKLNPSEIEGGRVAVIRGVVKGAPGNIKDKENVRTKLIQGTIALGAVASIGVLGLRGHGLMMNVSAYRNGIGRKMEDAVDTTMRGLLDNNPLTGPGRASVRSRAAAVLQERTALIAREPEIAEAAIALRRVVKPGIPTKIFHEPTTTDTFVSWYTKEADRVLKKASLAEDSADNFMRAYYNPPSSVSTRDAAIERIKDEAKQLRKLAEQNNVDRNKATEIDAFVKRMLSDARVTPSMRVELEKDAAHMLSSTNFDAGAHYTTLRNRTVDTYKRLYKEADDKFPLFYNPDGTRRSVAAAKYDFADTIVIGHARLRASVFQGNTAMVRGSFTADLTHLQFFKLRGRKERLGEEWTAPRGLVMQAAAEIGSGKPKTVGEALDLLRTNGFRGLNVEEFAVARPQVATGETRRAAARAFILKPEEVDTHARYMQSLEVEKLPNGAPKYTDPEVMRKRANAMVARDRAVAAGAARAAAPKPAAAARKAPTGPNRRARRPAAARAALPVPTERMYPGWAEDNLKEFARIQKLYMREARKTLTRPGSAPDRGETMRLAATWMENAGWLTPEPDGWKGGNFDSAERSDAYQAAFWTVRHDKKCGESGIPDGRKCSKKTQRKAEPIVQTSLKGMLAGKPKAPQTPEEEQKQNNIRKVVATGLLSAGAVALLLKVRPSKIEAYRKNIAKSAIDAEAMSHDIENKLRADAARRMGKPVEKVTGLEASAYNFKDKAQDTGFGAFNDAPEYFGQTKSSRGAVVVLSYADNDRGQGGYNLVKGGVFNGIVGEHDLLPFANRIGQPNGAGAFDYVTERRVKKAVEKVKTVATKLKVPAEKAEAIGTSIEGAIDVGKGLRRFKYLRDNVNERGFNPDAVRAAAFVVAQRRLTGKPVHILAYSNGGNVAVETLRILENMGYKDVKVVNVAGPAFGMFQNPRNNLRTWVSKGDEFWRFTGGRAFAGGNTKLLDNDNIPHEIEGRIHPSKPGAKAARNARQSYMLDQQLQKEAYTYLTVDTQRAVQLRDEFLYKAVENKDFDGDIGTLFGDKAQAAKDRYYKTWKVKGTQAAKDELQDDIEQRMIDTWYDGYSAPAVKKRQKELRAEFEAAFKEQDNQPAVQSV